MKAFCSGVLIVLSLLLVLMSVVSVESHQCLHGKVQRFAAPSDPQQQRTTNRVTTLRYKDNNHRRDATTMSPIRIHFNLSFVESISSDSGACSSVGQTITSSGAQHSCTSADLITPAKLMVLQSILSDVSAELSSLFSVIPVYGAIDIPAGSYGYGWPLPLTTGHSEGDADIIIFVTTRPIPLSLSSYTYGGEFQVDQYGRPCAGHLNWNPRLLIATATDPLVKASLRSATMHELIHMFGFSSGLFSSWNTAPVLTTANNGEQSMMITPTVVKEMKQHFSCHTTGVVGALMEDSEGTTSRQQQRGSHWEKTVFMNEIMTAIETESELSPVVSQFTLAAMEDSGWYQSNWSRISKGSFVWGKDAGCDFISTTTTCQETWKSSASSSEGYWCDVDGEEGCSFDRRSVGSCDITDYSYNITPAKYRYFKDRNNRGGSSVLSNYCPHVIPYYTEGWCIKQGSTTPNSYGELTGSSSRCFKSSLIYGSSSSRSMEARCYPTHCAERGLLYVSVGGYWYDCSESNRTITVANDYSGALLCPVNSTRVICNEYVEVDETFPVITAIDPSQHIKDSQTITITFKYNNNDNNNNTAITLGDRECIIVSSSSTTVSCVAQAPLGSSGGVTVDLIVSRNGWKVRTLNAITFDSTTKDWINNNAFIIFCAGISAIVLLFVFAVILLKCCDRFKTKQKYKQLALRSSSTASTPSTPTIITLSDNTSGSFKF